MCRQSIVFTDVILVSVAIVLVMGSVNERRRYNVTSSLIA